MKKKIDVNDNKGRKDSERKVCSRIVTEDSTDFSYFVFRPPLCSIVFFVGDGGFSR